MTKEKKKMQEVNLLLNLYPWLSIKLNCYKLF